MLKLDTKLTDADVRTELKGLSLFSLIEYMRQKDWVFALKTDEGFASITFYMDKWNDILGFEYGYVATSLSEEVLLATTCRAAELCLRASEVFAETYPQNFITEDGFLEEDVEMKEKEPEGIKAMLQFNCDRPRRRNIPWGDEVQELRITQGIYATLRWGTAHGVYTAPSMLELDQVIEAAEKAFQ